ncbi:hypothetical protein ANCDUO_19677 [Ancylostoma duodenale]|uniref:Uncharacterized protein n=1 Tax=Ancylostoma duodenale TaxID=51022 RepID=A0A0C2FNR8_9BILA|nr:hypothetical protein ANCDUO_19677 [Ancylostoma duodenale]
MQRVLRNNAELHDVGMRYASIRWQSAVVLGRYTLFFDESIFLMFYSVNMTRTRAARPSRVVVNTPAEGSFPGELGRRRAASLAERRTGDMCRQPALTLSSCDLWKV